MKALNVSNDLTIILPAVEVRALRKISANIDSQKYGLSPLAHGPVSNQLQRQKMQCLVGKRRRARWPVVGAMAILAPVLVTTLAAATRLAVRPIGEDRMAALVVGQGQAPEELMPASTVRYPLSQTCSPQPTHGTAVNFVATPADAANEARKNNKLTLLLHISGNFEDAEFT